MHLLKQSIGLKIFGMVTAIVIVMLGVASYNFYVNAQVGHSLGHVIDSHMQAYGLLGRANVSTMEKAYWLRGHTLNSLLGNDPEFQKAIELRIESTGEKFKMELEAAHGTVQGEINEPGAGFDQVALARIDERLAQIKSQQAAIDRYAERIIASTKENLDRQQLGRDILKIAETRNAYNEYFMTTRNMMFASMKDAAVRTLELQTRTQKLTLAVLLLTSLTALLAASVLIRQMLFPVGRLLNGTHSVIEGKLDISIPVTSNDEIGRLTEAFNTMVCDLRKANTVKEMFGKYVDPRIVRDLIEHPDLISAGGGRRTMTVLFCDLQGFTDLGEGLTPQALVKVMNRHFTLMSQAILENQGVIDKFIGDAVMAYWGPPFCPEEQQAELAVRAALAMQEKMNVLKREFPELTGLRKNLPPFHLRIGLATGEAVLGNIGSEQTKSFTVIGDTVNLASRFEGANKKFGTSLLASEETVEMLGEKFAVREVGKLLVLGKTEPKRVYEIMSRSSELPESLRDFLESYDLGLIAYRRRDWPKAREHFNRCLSLRADDHLVHELLSRVEKYAKVPPPPDWEEIWQLTEK